jgi:organic hydroperoxide reductase OsmC/OhrA
MSEYTAEIEWQRGDQVFLDNRYSRRHLIRFDGGATLAASSSEHVVPRYSDPTAADPEEMFVASLSSCHMLWFLSIAARQKFLVDRYVDAPAGVMLPNGTGKLWMAIITLRPAVTFAGDRHPTREELDALHAEAHHECFIANSVRTEVRVEPVSA